MRKSDHLTDIFSYKIFAQMQGAIPEDEVERLTSLILLTRFSAQLQEGLRSRFAKFGISQSRYYILMLLYEKNDELMTPSQIAEFAGISRATASELIDGMEHEGLIERHMCENDRRMIQVSITEKGQESLKLIMPIYYKLITELMSCLTTEEVPNLVSILKKLDERLTVLKEKNEKDR